MHFRCILSLALLLQIECITATERSSLRCSHTPTHTCSMHSARCRLYVCECARCTLQKCECQVIGTESTHAINFSPFVGALAERCVESTLYHLYICRSCRVYFLVRSAFSSVGNNGKKICKNKCIHKVIHSHHTQSLSLTAPHATRPPLPSQPRLFHALIWHIAMQHQHITARCTRK